MPNHVENDLVIHGDPETLKAFMEFARGPAGTAVGEKETALLSAHRFIPIPDEYLAAPYTCTGCGLRFPAAGMDTADKFAVKCPQCGKSMKDWYNSGAYDWCCTNWGTKWGLYDIELTDDGSESGSLTYTFQTAWSPPVPIIQAMSKQFPSLNFALDYFEGGMGFMGSAEYENGQEVTAGSAPYHGDRGG